MASLEFGPLNTNFANPQGQILGKLPGEVLPAGTSRGSAGERVERSVDKGAQTQQGPGTEPLVGVRSWGGGGGGGPPNFFF